MEMRKVSELKGWERNPRSIDSEDLQRLKDQIQKLGQYKPIIISQDGTVLGGNMRLKAYQELGIEDIWVSVVDAPDDSKKLEYALSDNDRAGKYDTKKLIDLYLDTDIDPDLYQVDLGKSQSLKEIMEEADSDKVEPEVEFTQELMEAQNYVVLYFDNEVDWLNLQSLYPLDTVKALDSKPGFTKAGIGRVIRGVDFIKKVQNGN